MAVQYCNYDIKGTLAVSGTSTLAGAATIQYAVSGASPLLSLYNSTNGGGATIRFSDQTSPAQYGDITFYHSDSASQGGGASWHFVSEPDTVLVVGSGSVNGRFVSKSAGSVGEVDYGFYDDVNTGMVRTSADNVSLVAGGIAGVGVGSTAVSLKYAGTTKLTTLSTGVQVSGIMSATTVGMTNIVTNRIVKFNGSVLDDSTMTDDGTNVTMTGDFTVQGGDITLGGTGRIQGVDTVSASTDAANKAYVDAHVSPAGTYLPLVGGTMSGNIAMGDNDITGIDQLIFQEGSYFDDVGSANYIRLKYNSTAGGGLRVEDNQGHIGGYLYSDGNTTSSFGLLDGSGSWAVKCAEDAEVELRYDNVKKFETTADGIQITDAEGTQIRFVESNSTYTEAMRIIRYQDVLGFHYGDNANEEAFTINNTGEATAHKNLTVSGGNITLGGTGRIQGIDTVTSSTDAANKAYVDAHVSPAGTYLPLAGGTMDSGATIQMTGSLTIDGGGSSTDVLKLKGSARIQIENASATDSVYISNTGGSGASVLDLGGALSLVENGDATFTADVNVGSFTDSGTSAVNIRAGGENDTKLGLFESNLNHGFSLNYDGGLNQFLIKRHDNSASGTTVLSLSRINNGATFAGDITVSGGDITLGGTGRIQGIDTVSVGTDAANKTYVDAQIATIPSGLNFQGNWNASTNSPTLASGTGTPGFYYNVSVAGSTNLDGETDWQIGDWAVFVEAGATDKWEKIDNTSALTGTGVAGRVAYWDSTNNLTQDSDLTFDGSNLTVGGNLTVTGNQYFNGQFIKGDGKEMFRYSDGWLRINEDNDFGSGIYCGTGLLRTDGEFQIGGSGQYAKITSTGSATFAGSVTTGGELTFSNNNTGVTMKDASGTTTRVFRLNSGNTMYIGPIDSYAGGQIFYGAASQVTGHKFYVGAAAKLTIDSSGNSTFAGNVTTGANITATGDTGNSTLTLQANTGNWTFTNVQASRNLEISDSDGTGTVMTINTSGNVGIGVTGPTEKLVVGGKVIINNTIVPNNLAQLNIGSTGAGETRAIDIDGGWSGGENKSITFTHGSGAVDIVGQINCVLNGSTDTRLRWGKLYYNSNSSTYTMELKATSLTTANLTVAGSIQIADDTATASATKVGTMRYRTGTEYVEVTGTELVTNGDFATDTTWIKGTGWTISGGKASSAGNSGAFFYQNITGTTTGDVLKVVYEITNYTSGQVRIGTGSGLSQPYGTYRSAVGIYTEYITKTSTNVSTGFISNSFVGSIDNVSVIEVTAEDASYADMCMQTGSSTYEWVNIVRNTY